MKVSMTRSDVIRQQRWYASMTVVQPLEADPFRGLSAMRTIVETKKAYEFNPRSPLVARPDGRGGFVDVEGVPVAIF